MSETVIIIGGGPAGSTSAMNLLRLGLQPLIIESAVFPRFHIGESLTTECVDALGRLDLTQELKQLSAPKKSGVRIFSKYPENSFYVGAGDAWQVERAGFDKMMLDTAIKRGAKLISGRASTLKFVNDQWEVLVKSKRQGDKRYHARFVIDASGQKRFCYRQKILGRLAPGEYAKQVAFFSQFEHVSNQTYDNDDTLIFHKDSHEWSWMIPLSKRITSIGLVCPVTSYKHQKKSPEDFMDDNLAHFSEPLSIRTNQAKRVGKVRTVANYSYKIDHYATKGLYCVGDSHRFIDPIFSFGVEFAVVEAEYMAKSIAHCLESSSEEWASHENHYMEVTTAAQNTISDMLAYFWAHPWGFANMAHMRHKEEFLELFAGRIYEKEAQEGLLKMRASMA